MHRLYVQIYGILYVALSYGFTLRSKVWDCYRNSKRWYIIKISEIGIHNEYKDFFNEGSKETIKLQVKIKKTKIISFEGMKL